MSVIQMECATMKLGATIALVTVATAEMGLLVMVRE